MTRELIWSIPNDDEETVLRIRPLREHWEARGPGLLGHLSNTLPWLPIAPTATVHLLKPRVGGAGRVVSPNEIEFEAVLANPWPMLPEVVRLGWLLACAACLELPLSERQSRVNELALVPAVIASAEYVELASLNEPTLECAINHWFEPRDQTTNATQMFRWWNELANSSADITIENWQHAVTEL